MNGTILSSFYPNLEIARFTSEELNLIGGHSEETLRCGRNISYDFLPRFVCQNSGVNVRFHLNVVEEPTESEAWKVLKNSESREGFNEVKLTYLDEKTGHYVPANAEKVSERSRKIEQLEFAFILKIKIDLLPLADVRTDSQALHDRTTLFATELIGGYRHLIQKFESFIGQSLAPRRPAAGKLSSSDYHANLEDAFRLVCHFSYFDEMRHSPSVPASENDKVVAERITQINERGLDAFEDLRHDGEAFNFFIDELVSRWRIYKYVVKRKFLEYSIYRQMCLNDKSVKSS